MQLTAVRPWPELRPDKEFFWVFESNSRLPAADTSTVAPSGCSKLIIQGSK